jgi:DNA (cytosine-5)-methyltransferase 1
LTIHADVATYPTAPFVGRVTGLIASPPCPTFSAAGKGEGVDEFPYLHSFADAFTRQGWFAPASHYAWSDPRTPLVLEPLRWVADLNPEWVALEQVPALMPLWEHYAAIWKADGYSTWTGVLNAADYGVPQTRRRAFCLASRTRLIGPPPATHCKGGAATFFGELRPWVSMADALGWGMTEKPCVTLVAGSKRQGGADPLDGGSGARATIRRERERERDGWLPRAVNQNATETRSTLLSDRAEQ